MRAEKGAVGSKEETGVWSASHRGRANRKTLSAQGRAAFPLSVTSITVHQAKGKNHTSLEELSRFVYLSHNLIFIFITANTL